MPGFHYISFTLLHTRTVSNLRALGLIYVWLKLSAQQVEELKKGSRQALKEAVLVSLS